MSFNLLKFLNIPKMLRQRKWQEKIAGVFENAILEKMKNATVCRIRKPGEHFEIVMLRIGEDGSKEAWRVEPAKFFSIGLPFDVSKMFAGIFAEFGKSDLSGYTLIFSKNDEGVFAECFEGETDLFKGQLFDLVCDFIERNADGIGKTFNEVSPTLPIEAETETENED